MNQNNNEVLMYKVAAFIIFIVLIVLIVAMSVATITGDKRPDETLPKDTGESIDTIATPPVTDAPDTDAPITDAPITDAPITDAPIVTSPAETEPFVPVAPPSANVLDEIAAMLAKYPDTVLRETPDAGPSYIDKMVFLGDSTTNGLRHYKMLRDGSDTKQVWTPYNGTLTLSTVSFATIVYPETGAQITISEAVTAKKPEYLVITLGVNGVSFLGENDFKREYKYLVELVQDISPDTKIICQSIFPVARSYQLLKSINNEKIRAANGWILEVAHETGVKYLDTYSVMCDEEGWLPESSHNGDGLHPNSDTYTLELNNLRTHAFE